MRIIDLSQPYKMGMAQFPGTPDLDVKQIAKIEDGGFRITDFHAIVHVGTHCDAPAHCVPGAPTMEAFPIDTFIGEAVIVDACVDESREIGVEVLKGHDIKEGDIVLIRTGYCKYWEDPAYVEDAPYLTEELARKLAELKVKAVGMDFLSPDRVDSTTSPVHHILMENNIIIIENLANLKEIDVPRVFFAAPPILIDKADGGFTRAFAIIFDDNCCCR
ncbi:MAG: cyclase family protein [bacterium]|jgi:arylformamidase|nr:cyclase family protein [Bacillota bacterium]